MPLNPLYIKVAVDWWADKLSFCKQSGLTEEDRKNSDYNYYQAAEVLISMNKPKVSNDQIEEFSRQLTKFLTDFQRDSIILSVDYNPDYILSQALEFSKIPNETGVLPIKTVMWINNDKVEVKYGYAAPREKLI